MFLDASVLVAILAREPGYEDIGRKLDDVDGPFFVSPLVRYEACVALARHKTPDGTKPSGELIGQSMAVIDAFFADLDAQEIAISPEIGKGALDAASRFGKVVGHPADLNFGDCFAYACAKALNVALLYNGNDFARTDLA